MRNNEKYIRSMRELSYAYVGIILLILIMLLTK